MQGVNLLNQLGLADTTINSLIGDAGAGVVSGGILTAVVGLIRKLLIK
ncbi:hypothetical protein [Legionella gratiana]|nr:hypothetical protein [Legionella gratiana]